MGAICKGENMELIPLIIVVVVLIGLLIFKEITHLKEKKNLLDQILAMSDSRAFINLTNAEIAKKEVKKAPKKPENSIKRMPL